MHIQKDNKGREPNRYGNGFVELTEAQWDQVFQILVDVELQSADDRDQFNKVVLDENAGRLAPCEVRLDGAKLWNYQGKIYLAHNIPGGNVPETLQIMLDTANRALRQLLGDQGGK